MPAMMLERIGTIGSTHGVKARPSPARKNQPSMTRVLPERIRAANQSCSETKPPALLAPPAALVAAAAVSPDAAEPPAKPLTSLVAEPPVPTLAELFTLPDAAPPLPDGKLTVMSFVIGG